MNDNDFLDYSGAIAIHVGPRKTSTTTYENIYTTRLTMHFK
jgi:hypothetical protein